MSWIYNTAYSLALLLLSPVIVYRAVRHGRYRRGWREKLLGRLPVLPTDTAKPKVWFHAVSVGEVLQLPKLIAEFQAATSQQYEPVVTTSTDTGYDLAIERFPNLQVTWFPLDFTWAVKAALARVQPAAVVLVELELWPNFLHACAGMQIPTSVINARISESSFKGYAKFPRIFRPVFRSLTLAVAQSKTYAERLIELGCTPESVTVSGNIKFDGVTTDRDNLRTKSLKEKLGLGTDEIVFLAGSTQATEEAIALDAWNEARQLFPNLRIILVPRHKERFQEVANLVRERGYPLVQRSTLNQHAQLLSDSPDYQPVILIDTIGELSAAWGLADIAFVGGSFGNRGGQNMLEPAAYGAAVTFGPNTKNFRDIVKRLLDDDAAVRLEQPQDLNDTLQDLLQDQGRRRQLGENAATCVQLQQGAIRKTIRKLCQLLKVPANQASNAA
ncbi:MAG: 3-deoxy-D-manno-octulosonic acid transferase [Fuerstiella sp.]